MYVLLRSVAVSFCDAFVSSCPPALTNEVPSCLLSYGFVLAGTGCPLSALKDAVLNSIVDVGSWQDICHHVPFTQAVSSSLVGRYGVSSVGGYI